MGHLSNAFLVSVSAIAITSCHNPKSSVHAFSPSPSSLIPSLKRVHHDRRYPIIHSPRILDRINSPRSAAGSARSGNGAQSSSAKASVVRHSVAGIDPVIATSTSFAKRIVGHGISTFMSNWKAYSLIPLIAGFVGWFTNYLAVQMIFYPVRWRGLPIYKVEGEPLGLIGWQGE